MRESFEKKSAGDGLSARHVNTLSAVCRRFANGAQGSFTSSHGTFSSSSLPPFQQHLIQITSDDGDYQYKGKLRFYDHSASSWTTSDEEYTVDASESALTLTVGSKIVCFWHEQRGALIPIGATAVQTMKIGKTAETIVGNTKGTINIWRKPNDTEIPEVVVDTPATQEDPEEYETLEAWNDWLHGGRNLEADKEVIIAWFADESVWRVVGELC